MDRQVVLKTIRAIARQARQFVVPSVTRVADKGDPYLVLISCILSLRTKDKTTVEAGNRLFSKARTCAAMGRLSESRIARLIYPVGFYRKKAKVIRDLSQRLCRDLGGQVPDSREGLMCLKGVGRKTANLVLGLGFKKAAVCVDTHVHRISNRLGWIRTRTPLDTELALERLVPKRLWIELNTVLVAFGQNICQPVSPLCSQCRVSRLCEKLGVKQSR
jgi:endonuclease III